MNAARPTPRKSTLGSLGHPAAPAPVLSPVPEPDVTAPAEADDPPEGGGDKATAPKKTAGRKRSKTKDTNSNKGKDSTAAKDHTAANEVRPSMISIPEDLDDQIQALGNERSRGELVIAALEYCHKNNKLDKLLGPAATTTGGGLFDARPTRGTHATDEPRKVHRSVRLRVADWAVVDQLVERHGVASRSHLITIAMRDYLKRK